MVTQKCLKIAAIVAAVLVSVIVTITIIICVISAKDAWVQPIF